MAQNISKVKLSKAIILSKKFVKRFEIFKATIKGHRHNYTCANSTEIQNPVRSFCKRPRLFR